MDMLASFAGAFGGVWFAVMLLIFVVAGCAASEYDNVVLGGITLLLGLTAMQWLGGLPIWAAVVANPLLVLLFAAVYLAIGAAYAGLWRFRIYVNNHNEEIMNNYRSYLRSEKLEDSTESFEKFLGSTSYKFGANWNKNRLGNWTLMWPFAMGWELSHKPFIALYNKIYYMLGDMFNEISRRAARGIYKGRNQ